MIDCPWLAQSSYSAPFGCNLVLHCRRLALPALPPRYASRYACWRELSLLSPPSRRQYGVRALSCSMYMWRGVSLSW